MPDPQDELRAFITGVRRRWLSCARLRGVGWTTMAAALPLAAAVLTARFGEVHGKSLAVTAVVGIAASLVAAGFVARRTARRPDDRRVARLVEEWAASAPGIAPLHDTLATAVAITSTPEPDRSPFHALLIGAALERLRGITPAAILPVPVISRAALHAVAGCVMLALAMGAGRIPLRQAVDEALLAWYPESLQIEVVPGDVRVAAGQPLRVRAILRAGGRVVTRVVPSLVVVSAGDRPPLPMVENDNGFETAFESVDRAFRYQVTAGSQSSREFTVTALFAPKVQRIDAHYEFPAFSGLAPRDAQDGGDLYAPQGSRVRLRVHTDKPIASGAMALASGAHSVPLRLVAPSVLETDLVLTRDDSYRLRLADLDGQQGGGDTEYFIRLMDDRPPDVRILRPVGDQEITPLEEVTIEARADDDYGVAAFDLVYAVAGRPEQTIPFSRMSGTNVARLGAHLLAAEALKVQPGDVITYYARARDIARGKRSVEAKSDMFFLEVRPFTEQFVSAQSQAMAAAGDPQLDALIAAQKEIISATWNVERRTGAGRSAADIKSIAQAQAELKARALQMGGGGPGRSSPFQMPLQIGPFGQRRARPAGADAVAAAVAAMALAAQQLDAEKTREAMPHEMRALQGLLQAQAEVQRQQVSQQANGSGNGSGRQGQDLSALFDKELQRQQRTNYETPSRAEDRPSSRDDDTARDRLRELARRQDDLGRQARELAQAALSQEEKKRQLETLSREQQQLRQEAEALTKQLAGGAGGRSAEKSANGSRGDLRGAATQMAQAANDLARGDPGAAAARSDRAAQQLRSGAERARGAGQGSGSRDADGQGRSAQQLADARSLSRQLDESRAIRDRLDALGAKLRAAEAQARAGAGNAPGGRRGVEPGAPTSPGRAGRGEASAPGGDSPGRQSGGQGRGAQPGGSSPSLEQLRQEYGRELAEASKALGETGQGAQRNGMGGTPEQQTPSHSSPGNEAFKQDFSNWESLRKDVDLALEQHDAAVSARLAKTLAADRLSAGASERVPDAYARLIARYYASLARATK